MPVRFVVLGPGQMCGARFLEGLDVEIVEAAGTDGMAALDPGRGWRGLSGAVLLVLADMPEITARDIYLDGLACMVRRPRPSVRAATRDGRPATRLLFSGRSVVRPGATFGG